MFSAVVAASLSNVTSDKLDVIGEFEYALLLADQPSLIICNGAPLEVASMAQLRTPKGTVQAEMLEVVT